MKKRNISQAEKDRAWELKCSMHVKCAGICFHCGKYNDIYHSDLAHRIPAWGWLIEKYGAEVIYDEDNMNITCKEGNCNSKSNMNPSANPVAVEKLAKEIKEKLMEEGR